MTDNHIFKFKHFSIDQSQCTMKVGTDGILLGAWCDVDSVQKVLDIGTGTGLIALMIAQRAAAEAIDGVEVDQSSCNAARKNFMTSEWHDRLSVFNSAIQDFSKKGNEIYDLIVCNPPFFSGGTLSTNQNKNNVRHTIKLSHQDLLRSTRSLIHPKGKFCVILPLIEGLRFIEMAETYGLFCKKKTSVFPKNNRPIERLLLEFTKEKKEMLEDELVVYESKIGKWTEDYAKLTEDFYLV